MFNTNGGDASRSEHCSLLSPCPIDEGLGPGLRTPAVCIDGSWPSCRIPLSPHADHVILCSCQRKNAHLPRFENIGRSNRNPTTRLGWMPEWLISEPPSLRDQRPAFLVKVRRARAVGHLCVDNVATSHWRGALGVRQQHFTSEYEVANLCQAQKKAYIGCRSGPAGIFKSHVSRHSTSITCAHGF